MASISTFIYTVIQTNLVFANTTWKHMIMKNLDYLFKMFLQRVKHHKNTPQIFQTEFWLSFCNNTRWNKINQMAALRMYWYSLISMHEPVSRAVLCECLILLDHLSREVELWTFETISQQGFDCKFKISNALYYLSKGF